MDHDADDFLDFAGMLLAPAGAKPATRRPEYDPAEADTLEGIRSAPFKAAALGLA